MEAIRRYQRIIKSLLKRDVHSQRRSHHGSNLVEHPSPEFRNSTYFSGYLDEVTINLKNPCEREPHPQMTETCKLFTYCKPYLTSHQSNSIESQIKKNTNKKNLYRSIEYWQCIGLS